MSGLIIATALSAGIASAQTMYKVVTPDGKVFYTDRPPASGMVSVEPMQTPRSGVTPPGLPAGTAPISATPGPRMGAEVPQVQGPPPRTLGALRSTKEMNDLRECTRVHQTELALMKASEEVMRSVNNLKMAGTRGTSSYQKALLESQWKYYKSLGGMASSPEDVRMPEDPCMQVKEVLQGKSTVMETQYQECAASHPKEMKLSALSKELSSGQRYLVALERIREEKRNNPSFDSGSKGSGEYARAFQADPLLVRAELGMKFQEYRDAGGPATRLEDVREIPNPCLPTVTDAPRPSPINQKRTLTVPRE
jgi:hypothetical protein